MKFPKLYVLVLSALVAHLSFTACESGSGGEVDLESWIEYDGVRYDDVKCVDIRAMVESDAPCAFFPISFGDKTLEMIVYYHEGRIPQGMYSLRESNIHKTGTISMRNSLIKTEEEYEDKYMELIGASMRFSITDIEGEDVLAIKFSGTTADSKYFEGNVVCRNFHEYFGGLGYFDFGEGMFEIDDETIDLDECRITEYGATFNVELSQPLTGDKISIYFSGDGTGYLEGEYTAEKGELSAVFTNYRLGRKATLTDGKLNVSLNPDGTFTFAIDGYSEEAGGNFNGTYTGDVKYDLYRRFFSGFLTHHTPEGDFTDWEYVTLMPSVLYEEDSFSLIRWNINRYEDRQEVYHTSVPYARISVTIDCNEAKGHGVYVSDPEGYTQKKPGTFKGEVIITPDKNDKESSERLSIVKGSTFVSCFPSYYGGVDMLKLDLRLDDGTSVAGVVVRDFATP